ncbi:PEP-CTERM sorting domain-containing protein [Bythopirellula goksoeyrii]|uniref:Ice-binding protein C-terminal domain-containing protein n=1 Tax=Bythopirellula goksoeyrii TaxID=1400387 RepID=A0A5B9Q308_9BACT|nr:PEP-CTERM sorting domain-containing protein [Bythopirellula goksoeyrii]QEG33384.1 hypothetical protein Pr1d_06450 [Bythopirellula goksoeyrii]
MNSHLRKSCFACLAMLVLAAPSNALAQHAVEVLSYDSGSTPASGFTSSSAALGIPERDTGEGVFPGEVTLFNPPWLDSEIVSIGEGGFLELRLSNYVLADPTGPELGVFTNVGFIDVDFPNGQIGSPPGIFGADSAEVSVSEDGLTWFNLGEILFDLPTQGYADTSGTIPLDFQQPFTGVLADFAGLPFENAVNPDALELLAGSGGGTWLDISGAPFSQIGYVRFAVADDLDSNTSLNFELDGVSISTSAMGGPVPEPGTCLLLAGALSMASFRRR